MKSLASDLLYVLNQALGRLDEDPVTDYDDPGTTAAEKAKLFMQEAIAEAQQQFFWQELNVTTDPITADAEKDSYERYRYPIPDDCLVPLGVRLDTSTAPATGYASVMRESGITYEISGNWIVTSADSVKLHYTKYSEDPSEWTTELTRVIYYLLASEAAQLVTGDPAIAQNVFTKYERFVKPFAKLAQSKYRNSGEWLPRGFSNLTARYR